MSTWRSSRRPSPPAGSVAVISHITDQRRSFADRSALSIQRGVEKLSGGGVQLTVKLPSGDIKVWTRSDTQTQRLLGAMVFTVPSSQSGGQDDIPIHFTMARTQKIQGLVYAPLASGESESELADSLTSQGVSAVRRLPPRGRHSDGALLVLSFEGPIRPDYVVLLYQRLEVRPFVPYPLRCGRCQRYRHHARFCKRPVRYGRCAGAHLTQGCTQDAKCAACGESHTVMDNKCSVWRAEFLINRWMAIDGLSLADARRRVEAPSSPRPTTAVTETPQGRDHETRAQGAASGRGSMQADGPANAGPAVSQSGCWSGGPPPLPPPPSRERCDVSSAGDEQRPGADRGFPRCASVSLCRIASG